MGIDIFVFPERWQDGRYQPVPDLKLFDWRFYGMFAFFGYDRNGEGIPPILPPRGFPHDSPVYEENFKDAPCYESDHGSWLSVRELVEFDYDATFVAKIRASFEPDGTLQSHTIDPTAALPITFRCFLGPYYFAELSRLVDSGADRIAFLFA